MSRSGRNRDFAWSYRQIAKHGRDAFYKGEISERILRASAVRVITEAGLSVLGEWVAPI